MITILTLSIACIAINHLLLVWTIQRIELQNRSRLDALLVRLRRSEPPCGGGEITLAEWEAMRTPRPLQGTPNPPPREP